MGGAENFLREKPWGRGWLNFLHPASQASQDSFHLLSYGLGIEVGLGCMLSFIYHKWSTKRHDANLILPVIGAAPIRERRLLNYFW